MADPISIIASVVGIFDVSYRVIRYLKHVHAEAKTVEADIAALIHEIEALTAVTESLKTVFEADLSRYSSDAPDKVTDAQGLWKHTATSLEHCSRTLDRLDVLVKEIYGDSPSVTSVVDQLSKTKRKRSRERELRQCRDELSTFQRSLQIFLTSINLYSARESQGITQESLEGLSQEINRAHSEISSFQRSIEESSEDSSRANQNNAAALLALSDLRKSFDDAVAIIKSESTNKHFDIPQQVSGIFTGRREHLERLRHYFFGAPTQGYNHQQRRFVVYGIGGSGKTQFCSKFADDNRHRYVATSRALVNLSVQTERLLTQQIGIGESFGSTQARLSA
jgi:hypothetical protein